MARLTRQPPPLAPGARVALVAPAGPLRDERELVRACDNARELGWEPAPGAHALDREGYFAGPDATRLDDFNRALRDDKIDGVWCLRGGYGAMRLLPYLDYDALQRHPKAILGYSDVTAIHLALLRRADLASFHAPTARAVLTPDSRASLHRATVTQEESCGRAPAARVIRPGRARGTLVGGNLALVAALVGTPFAAPLDGAILVLEDIGEAVYRMDRMLQQLLLSGSLHGCRALVFGQCTDCPEASDDGARRLDEVLAEIAKALNVPCVAGMPFGHIPDQWTLPLGAVAELDADARTLYTHGIPAA